MPELRLDVRLLVVTPIPVQQYAAPETLETVESAQVTWALFLFDTLLFDGVGETVACGELRPKGTKYAIDNGDSNAAASRRLVQEDSSKTGYVILSSTLSTEILEQYDTSVTANEDFRTACETLIRELIRIAGVRLHSVQSRVKTRTSLEKKIARPEKQYGSLRDITDIVGIRLITHLEDEVDEVGKIIETQFKIDYAKSVDKRQAIDPDRFGYLSRHYICSISHQRCALPEYRRYQDLWCEIQVRSILQHAWAEIEHDLGYKSGTTIPSPIRRRFSRLAGLLEIADAEFINLRRELADYERQVNASIDGAPESLELDSVSLAAFIETDPTVRKLDEDMAAFVGAKLIKFRGFNDLTEHLKYVGCRTVRDLREKLLQHNPLVLAQWKIRLQGQTEKTLGRGLGLFQLFQVLLVAQGGEERLVEGFDAFGIASPSQSSRPYSSTHAIALAVYDAAEALGRPIPVPAATGGHNGGF